MVWTIQSCAMADLFFSLRILEGIQRGVQRVPHLPPHASIALSENPPPSKMASRTLVLLSLLAGAEAFAFSSPGAALASRRRPAGAAALVSHQRAGPVRLAEPPAEGGKGGGLGFLFDIGTKGGIVFYSVLGIVVPFVAYGYMTGPMDVDIVTAGNVILVLYVGAATVGWTASYVFRVANKDMTYAKQLKDYEQAVIQKRFDELSGDEVDALMGEIYPSKPGAAAPTKE